MASTTVIITGSDCTPPDNSKHGSLARRLGGQALSLLLFTLAMVLAVSGFISYVWFAGLDNSVWHRIMITGWVTRSVTISTLVLRFAVDIQTGIAGAMLAAIVLETASVRLHDAARVSMMRATSPQLLDRLSLIPAMNGMGIFDMLFTGQGIVIILLSATAVILQFSSTLLLSDLSLGQLPGPPTQDLAAFDFQYQPDGNGTDPAFYRFSGYTYPIQLRTSTWLRPPPAFPAFAEYSNTVPAREGVDDTGVLLRGFLPFADVEVRETIRNYTGTAMVLDSRVSCQAPELSHLHIASTSKSNVSWTSHFAGKITGKLSPSVPDADRLWTPGAVAFDCSVMVREGAIVLCQISSSNPWFDSYADNGGLLSEFWNITRNDTRPALVRGTSLWSLPIIVVRLSNITSENIDTTLLGTTNNGIYTNINTAHQTWSLSVCYSAFATADLNVNMHGESSRKEPIVHWSTDRGYYTIPDVHAQLGEVVVPEETSSARGILKLDKKISWIPSGDHALINAVQPFVQQFVDVTNPMLSLCAKAPVCSALLPPSTHSHASYFYQQYVYDTNRDWTGIFLADLTLSSLFHQTLAANNGTGSLARAMSSLITTLSSMAYYDQMPQFAQMSTTTQIYFTKVLFPQSRLGFWAVMGSLALHVALVGLIAFGFAVRSKYTFLGNYWQSVAQLHGPATEDLISRTVLSSDQEVKAALAAGGYEDFSIGVRPSKNGHTAGLRILRGRKSSLSARS